MTALISSALVWNTKYTVWGATPAREAIAVMVAPW